jgi:glycosyltransferase involved in cell wall biosynthesis
MNLLTAVLHTENDALRLGRALETLYPFDDILIVDHGSSDGTARLARQYGARVIVAEPGDAPQRYLLSGAAEWLFVLDPREALTESLAASLYEWKSESLPSPTPSSYSIFLREETSDGWIANPIAKTRLVPTRSFQWDRSLPPFDPRSVILEGELLRFTFP